MKWIELIRVRSSADALEDAMPDLMNEINAIRASSDTDEVFIMNHALYDGDLSVVVLWLNTFQPEKTREGLLLAKRLSRLGSIDHAVWIPVKQQDQYTSENNCNH